MQLLPTPSPLTAPHLGGAQLVALGARALHDGARDCAVIQPGVAQQVGRERPEVVHKIGVGALGGEAGAADAHRLQHACDQYVCL